MANAYGQEAGKIVTHFTGLFGLPPYANLTVVETENGAPNGYSAPGLLFLNPRGIGKEVNAKLLSNQISRQWWGSLLSPASRNHLWLSNGLANYSDMLIPRRGRSEEHTSELQSPCNLVCRLLLEKKNTQTTET